MANRLAIANPFENTPAVTPAAAGVNTYSAPAPQPDSGGLALFGALKGLDKVVNPLINAEYKKAAKKESDEGTALFMKNREGFRDAIRSGAIPAGASPHVRMGYRQAQLGALSGSYSTQLARSLQSGDFEKIEDPKEIESYLNEFYTKFTKETGLDQWDASEVAEGFLPTAQKANTSFRQAQVEKNITWIEGQRFRAFEGEVIATLDMQGWDGSTDDVAGASAQTSEWLQQKVGELDGEGLDRTTISKTVIDIISSEAVNRRDTDILDLLKTVKLGTGNLYGSKAGRKAYAVAEDRIQRESMADSKRWAAAQKAQEKADLQALEEQYYKGLQTGDAVMVDEATAAIQATGAWSLTAKLAGKEATLNTATDANTSRGTLSATLELLDGSTDDAEVRGVLATSNLPQSTKISLYNQYTSKLERPDLMDRIDEPRIQRVVNGIVKEAQGNKGWGGEQNLIAANDTRMYFTNAVMDYLAANPEATDRELLREANTIAQELRVEILPAGEDYNNSPPLQDATGTRFAPLSPADQRRLEADASAIPD